MWDFRRMLLNQESSKKATAPAVAFRFSNLDRSELLGQLFIIGES